MKEMIELESDGITLEKYYEETAFHLPSIVYEFTSTRDDDVTIRLTERVPESIELEDLGFHNDYGPEHWELHARSLVFEYQLVGGAEYKTVIGIRRGAAANPENIAQEPEKLEVAPVADSKPMADTGDPFARSGTQATAEPTHDSPATSEERSHNGDDREDEPSTQPETKSSERSILDQFVTELKAGEISDENLAYLREHIGSMDSPSNRVDARVKQLQRDIADLRAYRSGLESFIDEHGSAEEVLEQFDSRMDEMAEKVGSNATRSDDLEAEITEAQTDIEDNEESIAGISSDVSEVLDEVEALSRSISEIETQLPDYDIEDRISELEADLDHVRELQERLRNVFAEEPDDHPPES